MRSILVIVIGLISLGFSLITCPNMVELDPLSPISYCSERYLQVGLKPGDYCLIRPERVRPTQVFVGKVEMECTKSEMESKDSSKLREYVLENFVPTVIGPGLDFFITDHHHFAVALFQAFLDFKRPAIHRVLYACIQADYSQMSEVEFWQKMVKQKFVFLEDERGRNITVNDLPPTLKLMSDNPYRTLASWLRKSNAYIKCGSNKTKKLPQCANMTAPFFIECYWADYMRRKFPLHNYVDVVEIRPPLVDFIYRASLQLQVEALSSILKAAVNASLSSEAKSFPGYNLSRKQMPPLPVLLDNHGCPIGKQEE